ncbi:MgtC/SapB family protein [Rossellomorea aquimaris]|nr:MgtC/SapB family protein [Rossellomorea aquimaris]
MDIHHEILIKLGIATLLGMIIGFERELKRKPLGIKTTIIISVVSCLLTIVSIQSAYSFPKNEDINITMDPLRLAAQIVSGIGFLGAGVILRRGNETILGLTTAALIWGAAGLGIAVGAGFYIEATAGVILLIISIEVIPMLIRLLGPKSLKEKELLVQLIVIEAEKIEELIQLIKQKEVNLKQIRINDKKQNEHHVQMKITVHKKRRITDVYYLLNEIKYVRGVDIEGL